LLLVESNTTHRSRLAEGLRAGGFAVVAVATLAEIERWPSDEVVVTEWCRFSPWWHHVGASAVLVLADTVAEGHDACRRGATAWVFRGAPPARLLAVLAALAATGHQHDAGPTHTVVTA
jgi:hypothetical protein